MFILNGDNVLRGLLLATVGATTCLDDDRLVVVVLSVPRSANLGKLDDDEESSEEPEQPTDEEDRALILPMVAVNVLELENVPTSYPFLNYVVLKQTMMIHQNLVFGGLVCYCYDGC